MVYFNIIMNGHYFGAFVTFLPMLNRGPQLTVGLRVAYLREDDRPGGGDRINLVAWLDFPPEGQNDDRVTVWQNFLQWCWDVLSCVMAP